MLCISLIDIVCSHSPSSQLFPKFVLEFHLPFLALREESALDMNQDRLNGNQTGRHGFDVSFLTLQCAEPGSHEGPCKHHIQESQISVVICGWDHHNWVAWGIFNTLSDPTEEFDPDQEHVMKEDYFAADGDDGVLIDADRPLWDPREYWLHIIEIRVRLVLKEWKWLVRNLEAGVTVWVSVKSYIVFFLLTNIL